MTHQAIKDLVILRHIARRQLTNRDLIWTATRESKVVKAKAITSGDRLTELRAQIRIEECGQYAVENKFTLIQTGRWFVHVAHECEKLPRGDWLRALGVNESEWFTPAMLV